MNAVRGRVRGGRVELDAALPEGAEVVVLAGGDESPFELDQEQVTELAARVVEADAAPAEVEPAAAILARLRTGR